MLLHGQVLIRRPVDSWVNSISVGSGPGTDGVCKNWQEVRCRCFCRYLHACKVKFSEGPRSQQIGPPALSLKGRHSRQ